MAIRYQVVPGAKFYADVETGEMYEVNADGSFVLRYEEGRKAHVPVEVVPDSVQLLFCDAYKAWEFVRLDDPGAGEPSFTLS